MNPKSKRSCCVLQLTQDIQMRNNEAQRETRKRDKMDREMKQTKAELEAKASEIKTMQTQIQRYKEDIGKLEQQLKEQRVSFYLLNVF